jgi:hypothetical protein
MTPTLSYGIDVGRFNDRTAIVGVEKFPDGSILLNFARLLRSDSLPHQARTIRRLLVGRDLREVPFLVDITGVGIGLYDNLLLPRQIPITIGAGDGFRRNRSGYLVGKTALMALVAQNLPHLIVSTSAVPAAIRDELKQELSTMRVRVGPRGALGFNAKSGRHDDLVLALGLALFGLEPRIAEYESTFIPENIEPIIPL